MDYEKKKDIEDYLPSYEQFKLARWMKRKLDGNRAYIRFVQVQLDK